MKFILSTIALTSIVLASPQGVLIARAIQIARETHLEIHTHECAASYQDSNGLVWSIQKDHREDLHQNMINLFGSKTERPTRIEKHIKHGGKLIIKPHCHSDIFELVNRLGKRVNVCIGEARQEGQGHKKCKCDHLGPGESITHHGDDSIRINDRDEDECAGKGLFPLTDH
ncbi:hypothetical protein CONCODRAFT_13983 [Conidiobolus coronatus NRRL 28638]|uniref:Uncharacterized protein n=1 Tax=Conidiobolus coronatus (strain ATCC 28846 / CBS 209.66 / NRRL 28638) TaxID=796925 RepID=A0A137NPX4_CONC2|nr:hypothetical protein CONCODRAFT_13983 [Conidiobolus coronatus NRRL 28638]|eukprot:KXN64754.1 hypothetical protein CONCODRAFT_13983 [Conidiobolus coronatus NRRL 28638]